MSNSYIHCFSNYYSETYVMCQNYYFLTVYREKPYWLQQKACRNKKSKALFYSLFNNIVGSIPTVYHYTKYSPLSPVRLYNAYLKNSIQKSALSESVQPDLANWWLSYALWSMICRSAVDWANSRGNTTSIGLTWLNYGLNTHYLMIYQTY